MSFCLGNVVHEILASILMSIRRTDFNSVARLQLTNIQIIHVWQFLSRAEIRDVKFDFQPLSSSESLLSAFAIGT